MTESRLSQMRAEEVRLRACRKFYLADLFAEMVREVERLQKVEQDAASAIRRMAKGE